jgi:photosystem II stability/assembly factor-like uncharacterized protein
VTFADAARGYAVGERGMILRTDDGGKTWKDQEAGLKINLFSVAAASRDDVLVVGDQGRVLQTRDGGEEWELTPTVTSATLLGAAYHGGTAAWVAGRGGAILKRADSVATVKIPRPKLPPALRPAPKLTPEDEADALAPVLEDDIPRAQPPRLKPPSKP